MGELLTFFGTGLNFAERNPGSFKKRMPVATGV
jgi:hypothetical protein